MARTFRRPRQTAPISEMNVTNLVDLGFTLLIIFMIATPLINQEQTIQVNLPEESRSTQPPPDPETVFVSVSVDAQGRYYVDNQAVDWGTLQARLAEWARRPRQPVVRIRADGTVPYQQVVRLMDELKKNQLSRMTFDTQVGGGGR